MEGVFSGTRSKRSKFTFAMAACAVLLASPAPAGQTQAPVFGRWGVDLSAMAPEVRPGDDFHAYVNGRWLSETPIPPDQTAIGLVGDLERQSDVHVRDLLEEAPRPGTDPALTKARTLYRALLDKDEIERRGLEVLEPSLARLAAARSHDELAALLGETPRRRGAELFTLRVVPDARNPTVYAVTIGQAVLGLPDRDYYLSPALGAVRDEYRKYLSILFSRAGDTDPEERAAAVVAFEARVARACWSRAQLRNPEATYHRLSKAALKEFAPGFEWAALLESSGLGQADHVIVGPDTAVREIAALYANTPLTVLKDWMRVRRIDLSAQFLPRAFAAAHFDFRGRQLSGQAQPVPEWRSAVTALNDTMGEIIGRAYVERWFRPSAKREVATIAANIRSALRQRIERSSWMDRSTKQAALEKLARLNVEIGYPRRWRDYRTLEMPPDQAVVGLDRVASDTWMREARRYGERVNRGEWTMNPQAVNAYQANLHNQIVFPAALLQPPIYDANADPAVNYGAIGFIIGHEILHGFDDRGRKIDAQGRLRDWWTPSDAAHFEAQAAELGGQFAAMRTQTGEPIDPKLTMGENIADLGGLTLAVEAWRLRSKTMSAALTRDGFTAEQRLFLGWGQLWRTKRRDADASRRLRSDSHAPPAARANGPASNLDAFYEAFSVKPGDRLYRAPESRVRIW